VNESSDPCTQELEALATGASEDAFRLIVETIPGLIAVMTPDGQVEHVNRQVLEYFGRTREELKQWGTSDAVHPSDLPRVRSAWQHSIETGVPYEFEHRIRRADGEYRWFQSRGLPLRDAEGRIVRWYNLLTDIDERKRAEERVEASEREYRRIIDAIPQAITALSPDGHVLYQNQTALEYTGLTPADLAAPDFRARLVHPDDFERLATERQHGLNEGRSFELEMRTRHRSGGYRWCLIQYKPVHDEEGRIVRWYATGTDIHERRLNEDQIKDENVALREEVSRASMFEEIVGASPALKTVLSHLSSVAPTDSTVLISGETGTGKELIARAIHRLSRRAQRAFISLNCAATPPSLIASELFGHEKGAFTGAVQQRRGRFELAHSGTIFLDEIGEIPSDTQIALLRVLQERQIERVGGSRAIPVDVRVIAATNRDLSEAIASGTFRSDLFYRLNVFPIQVPPLRKRREDIPILVEYFVKRFAEKMAKRIHRMDKRTLELCDRYPWPGNIRELQNIVERSVILCSGDVFSIDEAWLSSQAPLRPDGSDPLPLTLQDQEREMIEAALTKSRGKVAGPRGAAATLGIPPSTLESKIKQLGIQKRRYTSAS
jgi:formate hydrogenlyase transcriptional activator